LAVSCGRRAALDYVRNWLDPTGQHEQTSAQLAGSSADHRPASPCSARRFFKFVERFPGDPEPAADARHVPVRGGLLQDLDRQALGRICSLFVILSPFQVVSLKEEPNVSP
jgi:hypothetical protein